MVKECIQKYKANVIIIQETKKENIQARLVKSLLGIITFDWAAILATGTTGGILIAWDTDMVYKLDEKIMNFSLSIQCVEVGTNFEWLVTRVYVPAITTPRQSF